MSAQEEFLTILRESGMVLICPKCGGQDWRVVRSDLAIHDPRGDQKSVFLIGCNACGHERLFSPSDPGGEPGD